MNRTELKTSIENAIANIAYRNKIYSPIGLKEMAYDVLKAIERDCTIIDDSTGYAIEDEQEEQHRIKNEDKPD